MEVKLKNIIVAIFAVTLVTFFLILYSVLSNRNTEHVYETARNVELRQEGDYLEWKYDDEDSWRILMDIRTLKGADGKDGRDGRDGRDGKDGSNGSDGINGVNGLDGINGTNGNDGKDGKDGKDGRDGLNGSNGLNGENGTNGRDGREIQFKNDGNKVYWKYSNETEWTLLIEVSENSGVSEICETMPVIENADEVDCVKNKTTCPAGTLLEINVSTNPAYSPMNFYVLKDNGTTMTLIANSNIGSETKNFVWYSQVGTSGGNNTYGPKTALETLNTLTTDWDNICSIKEFTYENPGFVNKTAGAPYKILTIENGVTKIVAGDDSVVDVEGIAKARLLTFDEAVDPEIGNCPHNGTCPTDSSWLYNNLVYATYVTPTTEAGYWLLTSYTNDSKADVIVMKSAGAKIDSSSTNPSPANRGLRPVIEITKK